MRLITLTIACAIPGGLLGLWFNMYGLVPAVILCLVLGWNWDKIYDSIFNSLKE